MAKSNDRPRGLAEQVAQSVLPMLRSQLRRRYSLLANDHDDLAADTLLGLVQFLRAHEKAPPSQDEAKAVAQAILKRRVADHFRKATREIIENMPSERLPSAADPHDSASGLEFRKLLQDVLAVLMEMDSSDQLLLMQDELSDMAQAHPYSAAERKRISRLRGRLRERFKKRFGVTIEEYINK